MGQELQHHGIIGQKWGLRRYQNEDGTLTEAGKKRKENLETNTSFGYKVGEKRLTKRLNKLEKNANKDMASAFQYKQMRATTVGNAKMVTEDTLNTPSRVASIGRKTIRNRAITSVGATAASGAAVVGAILADSAVPLVAVPASTIAAGVYWYKSRS